MIMRTLELLLQLTERMLDRHLLINIMICKESFRMNMREWDLSWPKNMKILDLIFRMRMKELESNLVKRRKRRELIFKLKWSRWDLRKTKDSLLFMINTRSWEELPLKPSLNTDLKSPLWPPQSLSTNLQSSATKVQSVTKKTSTSSIKVLRSTSPNSSTKRTNSKPSWKTPPTTS